MQVQSPVFQLFLMKFGSLPIGSIGTVVLESLPAYHEYTSKLIHPSKDKLDFLPKADLDLLSKFEKFATLYGLTSKDVKYIFKQIEGLLETEKKVNIEGIGLLKIENSTYRLEATDHTQKYFMPIKSGAVIHEGSVHEVKVGENVRTSDEMKAMLAEKPSKDYWWVYALLLVIVAVAALFYYLYVDPS